jgi:hypothetical protein
VYKRQCSNLASDNEELKQKYTQKEELDKQYVKFMASCKKRINWICLQDMCAIRIVRNAVMENSTECPTAKMTDCDVAGWVPEECSVSCDNDCDPTKPYKCGGWMEMRREIVVPNDECGGLPSLEPLQALWTVPLSCQLRHVCMVRLVEMQC